VRDNELKLEDSKVSHEVERRKGVPKAKEREVERSREVCECRGGVSVWEFSLWSRRR
jgi:hypothetical protein